MTRKSSTQEHGRRAARRNRDRGRKRRFAAMLVAALTVVAAAIAMFSYLGQSGDPDTGSAANINAATFTGGPRLAVDQTVVDHGNVPYGYEVQASYRLKNVGDQTLQIDSPEITILDGC